jgi:outer membrane protein assembly factor BamA
MGVTLALLLALAQVAPGEPPAISSVEVRLPEGADQKLLGRVPQLVTVRKGQPLSRRAVSRSIENLFATGRFADVVVEAEEGPAGVALTFILEPRQNIGNVFVEGARALLKSEVLAAAALEAGSEYWPERLEYAAEKVAALYRRRGYQAVRVQAEASTLDGVLAAGFVIEEGPPSRVESVAVLGEPGLPLGRLLEVLGLKPGDVLNQDRVAEGVEALRRVYRRERYFRARVELPEPRADGRVLVPVASGPRYEFAFSGNRSVSDRSLTAVLAWDGEELLDEALAQRLAARLTRFYRFRGFHDVRVRPAEVFRPGRREAALGFAIEEGRPLRVESVRFDGAQALGEKELLGVLRGVMQGAAPTPSLDVHATSDPTELEGRTGPLFAEALPAPSLDTVLVEETWLDAAKAMEVVYRERGYLRASVKVGEVELEGGTARARFVVAEGPRAMLGRVDVTGLPEGFASDAVASAPVGQPVNPDALQRLAQGVVRELGRKGYLFAEVEPSLLVAEDGTRAEGRLVAKPGPQVKVRAVLPVGQVRTDEGLITAQSTMKEGTPLDSEQLFSTQANLLGLGIFRSVQVEMLAPERPEPLKTVLLKVKERARGDYGIAPGYFFAEGLRVVVDGVLPNVGGKAINLAGHGMLNAFGTSLPALTGQVDLTGLDALRTFGGRVNVSAEARSLLPARLGLRMDVVGERVFRPQFRFSRVVGVPTLDWSKTFDVPRIDWLKPKLTLALQYEVEWSFVERVGRALTTVLPSSLVDQERLRFLFGEFGLHGVRFTPTLDLRDNALNPTKGLLVQGAAEVAGAFFAEDEFKQPVVVNFLKLSGLLSGYVPLPERMVLAVSARAGRIVPLSAGSTTPPVRRFYLGGATSVRGFNEDQLVAEDVRAEYRDQVRDCQVLVSKGGCTSSAQTVLAGRQVPSQGGELFASLKAELRIPAFGSFDLGVFFEAGNLWLATPTGLGPFRPVVGTGLRYVTPIGPLALDVGVNLTPDLVINEPPVVLHFNIGVF